MEEATLPSTSVAPSVPAAAITTATAVATAPLGSIPPPIVAQRRIAIAIDRTIHSVEAFNWYTRTLRRPGDLVALVHCVEPAMIQTVASYPLYGLDPLVVGMYSQMDQDNKRAGTTLLEKAAAILAKRGIEHQTMLMEGYPKEQLMEAVKIFNPVMLIVGSRKLSTFGRFFLGSISDYLVHNCKCAVVVHKCDDATPTIEQQEKQELEAQERLEAKSSSSSPTSPTSGGKVDSRIESTSQSLPAPSEQLESLSLASDSSVSSSLVPIAPSSTDVNPTKEAETTAIEQPTTVLPSKVHQKPGEPQILKPHSE